MKIPKVVEHRGETLQLSWRDGWRLRREIKKSAKRIADEIREMEKEKREG